MENKNIKIKKEVRFILPPKGTFLPNNSDDPLKYYYKPFVGLLYTKRIQNGLSLLSSPYESILEFGYGSGLLLPTLSKISNTLYGIDTNSDPAIIQSNLDKVKVKATLIKKDITKVNFPENSFDLIVAFSVFEHIKNNETIIKEMHRILKPNGKLLVGMPRVDKIMERFFEIIGFKNIRHNHVKNHQDFRNNAEKYFRNIKSSKMPSFLPPFAALYYNMLFEKKL